MREMVVAIFVSVIPIHYLAIIIDSHLSFKFQSPDLRYFNQSKSQRQSSHNACKMIVVQTNGIFYILCLCVIPDYTYNCCNNKNNDITHDY